MDRIQPLRIMAGHLSDVDVSRFCILFICLVVWNLDKTKSFLLLKWNKMGEILSSSQPPSTNWCFLQGQSYHVELALCIILSQQI